MIGRLLHHARRLWHALAGHPPKHVLDAGPVLVCGWCAAVWGRADVEP